MEATADLAPTPETEIPRLLQLHEDGLHAQVLDKARNLLRDFPQNRDLHLLEAMSLRNLTRIDEALTALEKLERAQPQFSKLHQERGLCHLARREAPPAIAALARAVAINPSLPMSWRVLEDLYRVVGDEAKAEQAARQGAKLREYPPEVASAASLYADGEWTDAERIVRRYLQRHGEHPDALRLLAEIAAKRGLLDEAVKLLKMALAAAPDHRMVRYSYALVLAHQHKYREVHVHAEQLLAQDPHNKHYMVLAAGAALNLNDRQRADALCQVLLADKPDSAEACVFLGHALQAAGRIEEAVELFRAGAAMRPVFGTAYWSLADLKTYRFTDAEIADMRAAEKTVHGPQNRVNLCFALGKALEDRDEIAQSWFFYARGNALELARPHAQTSKDHITRQIATFTSDFFRHRAGWGDPRPDPIFILGLPRSGSTLLEQILASHSQVEGTQELGEVMAIARELRGRADKESGARYDAALTHMGPEDFRRLGERYLDQTRIYRTDKPFFIDKMPTNFRHVGLIHLMLPNARIIDARREPMSCCFSNFKQHFGYGQDFTYSLERLGEYYRAYLELMRHMDQVLPGRILTVHYEDVVADLEGSVKRILDYCGLKFEQPCVDFHKTRRNVRTPSSEQVRRPISREGLEQWKKFEPWLGPLVDALGDARFDYR